jgi:hypothetical protein
MRLKQLARKLSLKSGEIVDFLALHHIVIEDDPNARLEKEHVELVIRKFAPDELTTRTEWKEVEEKIPVAVEEPEPQGQPAPVSEEATAPEKTEVIKAPKIELSGLKVLGKIELPESKKKTLPAPPEEIAEPLRPVPENKRPATRRKQEPKSWKNPLEEQREREAREAKKKRQQLAQQAKEKRTENYMKRVKPSTPTKRAKLVEEQSVQISETELTDPPKTWLGKMVRWFRT